MNTHEQTFINVYNLKFGSLKNFVINEFSLRFAARKKEHSFLS